MFGKEPVNNLKREKTLRQVTDDFMSDTPSVQVYMITGVRGSGKTVFLSDAVNLFRSQKDWIVINISSDGDILEKIIDSLAAEATLARLFKSAKINLGFFGIGLEVSGAPQITNKEIALKKMLESLGQKNKRVLIAIDEVIRSKEMVTFASAFQLYVREDLPVFLLMTGLYENIEELQNVKNLTFLYRAPKLQMENLPLRKIQENYISELGVDNEKAREMAIGTKGYPYAFQLFGYYAWRNGGKLTPQVLSELKYRLNDYAYDIIWEKLSKNDRRLAYGIAKTPDGKTAGILAFLDISKNEYNPYRRRLINRGLINGATRGEVHFTLPFFDEYAVMRYEEDVL